MGKRNKKEYLRSYKERGAEGLPDAPDPEPTVVEGPVFTGRVQMFDDVRGFGFVIYEHEGRRQKAFFHVSDVLEGKPVQRAKATFELKPDDRDGRIIARNIRIDQDAPSTEAPRAQETRTKMGLGLSLIAAGVRGRVISFDPIKAFGFICTEADLGYQRVFFHAKAITRDSLGHRHDGVVVGTAVTFDIAEFEDETGGVKKTAQNVQPVNRTEVDVVTHSELSRVVFWDGTHGFLERSCGDLSCHLPFFLKDITTTGAEEIKVGDYVQHGVMPRGRPGSGQVRASAIVLYEPGFVPEPTYEPGSIEAQFLATCSCQEAPEPEPAPAPAEPGKIYSVEERRMSLKEIIAARRKAA